MDDLQSVPGGRSQAKNIPFIWYVQKKEDYRHRKYIRVACVGLGVENGLDMRFLPGWQKKQGNGEGCTTL